ncbi:MAG: tRNA lysidine(34) synthetase TilS [Clostridia bacterium]|nr:tRNA lysidine(34) synthetase TilS [Clostridia bacterium]
MKHNYLIESVRENLVKYNINNCSILVALSGGADSVCLLHALVTVADEFKLTISAAHVNHMLRGEEAIRDEDFAKSLCQKYNIPFYCERFNVKEIAEKNKQSIEEAGRDVRYSYFESLLALHSISFTATAHHADDNIETVVMRFIRGSGIHGLSGIPFMNNRRVIRPLLNVGKNEILNYINDNGLTYVNDSSNKSCEYHRNKIRNILIPQLEELNQGFKQSLVRNITLYNDTDRYIQEVVQNRFNDLATVKKQYICFLINDLNDEPDIIRHHLLALSIQKLTGGFTPDCARIFDVEKCLLQKNSGVSIGQGISAYVAYNKLYIIKESPSDENSYPLNLNGKTHILNIGTITCRKLTNYNKQKDNNALYLSVNALKNKSLYVRFKKDGDYFYPSGFGHKKNLQDFFVDNKVPRFLRTKIPLILADDDIVCVSSKRADERFAAKNNDTEIFEIIFTEDM